MKIGISFSALIVCGVLTVTGLLYATGFKLDVSGKQKVTLSDKVGKNEISFFSTAPMEDIKGTANDISGTVTIDPSNLEATKAKIVVKVAGMKTGIKKRDQHLRSPDWLDAASHPDIVFDLKLLKDVKIKDDGAKSGKAVATATAVGDFSMHGVSLEQQLPVTITYIRESDKTKARAPGDFVLVQSEFSVPLGDYKVQGKKGIIGSKVGEQIKVKANFVGSTGL